MLLKVTCGSAVCEFSESCWAEITGVNVQKEAFFLDKVRAQNTILLMNRYLSPHDWACRMAGEENSARSPMSSNKGPKTQSYLIFKYDENFNTNRGPLKLIFFFWPLEKSFTSDTGHFLVDTRRIDSFLINEASYSSHIQLTHRWQ